MSKDEKKQIIIDQIRTLAEDVADVLSELEEGGFLSEEQTDIVAIELDHLFKVRIEMLKNTQYKDIVKVGVSKRN